MHASHSGEQSNAEVTIRDRFSATIGAALRSGKVATMQIDGMAEDVLTYCEIFAHYGEVKSGQRHKLKGDVLKLTRLRALKGPTAKLYLLVVDCPAEKYLTTGWVGDAVADAGISVLVVPLPQPIEDELRQAQARQAQVFAAR